MAIGTHGNMEFLLNTTKHLFFLVVVKHWPDRGLVEFPSVEMVQTQLDMVLDKLTLPGQEGWTG